MLTRQRIDHRCLTRSPLPVPVAKAQSVEKYEGGKKVNRRRARCRHGPKPAAVASHASGLASLARPIACGRLRRARARAAQPAADGRRGTGGNAATWGVEGQKQSQAGGGPRPPPPHACRAPPPTSPDGHVVPAVSGARMDGARDAACHGGPTAHPSRARRGSRRRALCFDLLDTRKQLLTSGLR
jgi:hypothetical protein